MTDATDTTDDAVHRSPPVGALTIVAVVLLLGSLAVNAVMTGGARYPTPYSSIAEAQAYYLHFPDAMRVTAFLQFGAATLLGLFTATIVSRLLFHRISVAGVYIALFGGMAASAFLGLSALAAWALSQSGVATDAGTMRLAQLLAFATGGVGHVGPLGLLLAGVSVPSLVFRVMPRWVSWGGLLIAVVAEVSVISLVLPSASILLPLARFPALVWLIAAGFTMPKTRARVS
jgi:hypothetical protein